MNIKWSKIALKQFIEILEYVEENKEFTYSDKLQRDVLTSIKALHKNPKIYQPDRIKNNNDGSFFAFHIDSYRISFRIIKEEIRILRIRHTSKRPFTR